MTFSIAIFLILATTFTLASLMLISVNRWMAAYMAATAFICVATVGMAYGGQSAGSKELFANGHFIDGKPINPTTLAAVYALYAASDPVQRTIDADVCYEGSYTDDDLDHEGNRQLSFVMLAYWAAESVDVNANRDYCAAIGER